MLYQERITHGSSGRSATQPPPSARTLVNSGGAASGAGAVVTDSFKPAENFAQWRRSVIITSGSGSPAANSRTKCAMPSCGGRKLRLPDPSRISFNSGRGHADLAPSVPVERHGLDPGPLATIGACQLGEHFVRQTVIGLSESTRRPLIDPKPTKWRIGSRRVSAIRLAAPPTLMSIVCSTTSRCFCRIGRSVETGSVQDTGDRAIDLPDLIQCSSQCPTIADVAGVIGRHNAGSGEGAVRAVDFDVFFRSLPSLSGIAALLCGRRS